MKKITEIPVTRYRTVEEKNPSGTRTRKQVPYTTLRNVVLAADGKRLLHFFLDMMFFHLILYPVNLGLALAFVPTIEAERGAVTISLFSVDALSIVLMGAYYVLFEHFLGKTPGKFITRTRVINIYGKNPPVDTLMIRTLSRFIPFEAFSCIGGRGWHDRFSETYVVEDKEAAEIEKLLEEDPGAQPVTA